MSLTALRIASYRVGAAPSLSTFDVDVSFDPGILAFSSASFGDPALGDQLDIFGSGGNPTSAGLLGTGVLNLFELSFDPASDLDNFQADSFILATLTFDTLSAGTSSLDTSINVLGDALADPLTADAQSGGITSRATIPEPSSLLLLSLGLVSLVRLRQRLSRQ